VVRYLLVDDRDGTVLAEFASPLQAARLLGRQALNTHDNPPVSLVRVAHQQGSLSDVSSMVSVRLLAPPVTGPATSATSHDRPARQRTLRIQPEAPN
jgi:hypothetical protein